ncbi:MAG: SH3 domain-containing protein [Roseiflexaceae bacterium]
MDTEEMYQRGVADAERGELHPFYYQHYYHYRRGYDRTRRHLRRPRIDGGGRSWVRLAALLVLIVIGSGAFVVLRARSQPSAVPTTARPASTARLAAPTIVRTPIFPTITPSPPPPVLHIGGPALIANTEGRPLRGRQEPRLKSPVRASFKEGEQVTIQEGPVQADGYTWWQIEGPSGTGWSAEHSLEGVVWLQPTTD